MLKFCYCGAFLDPGLTRCTQCQAIADRPLAPPEPILRDIRPQCNAPPHPVRIYRSWAEALGSGLVPDVNLRRWQARRFFGTGHTI
jgi:hypothetical protein